MPSDPQTTTCEACDGSGQVDPMLSATDPANGPCEACDGKGAVSKTTDALSYAPGSFGCHEALHMASVAHDFVDKHLCEHPAIEQNPEWAAQAGYAAQAMYDLYQMIGAKHV